MCPLLSLEPTYLLVVSEEVLLGLSILKSFKNPRGSGRPFPMLLQAMDGFTVRKYVIYKTVKKSKQVSTQTGKYLVSTKQYL